MSVPLAATISIPDTLVLFDGPFRSLAESVGEGQYTFWLGSGISRERVDNVPALIWKVLEHFQGQSDPADPGCPARKALRDILKFAKLPKAYQDNLSLCIDSCTPVSGWPAAELKAAVDNLAGCYADILDVQVTGQSDEDHILWTVVGVAKTYGDVSKGPDCEHLCVALLASEAVVSEIPSANWDGLVEAAVDELRGGRSPAITVCVQNADLRGPRPAARLIKFHGCAVRAQADEATYRPLLIARRRQIASWSDDPAVAAMRAHLVHLATNTPTLMIGLSAQDENIKNVFNKAKAMMQWPWPSDPPAIVFAEEEIGQDQDLLLKLVYANNFTPNAAAIETSAHFQAFGKPLLTGLVLHVLCSKLRALVALVDASNLDAAQREALANNIRRLRDRVAVAAEGVKNAKGDPDRLAFVRALVRHTAHALSLFLFGQPRVAVGEYLPFTDQPVHLMKQSPHVVSSGQCELAAALALLSRGEIEGMGTLGLADPAAPDGGALTIVGATGTVRLFFAMNDDKLVQMLDDGRVKESDSDAVVIQSGAVSPRMPRSPHGTYGRTGAGGLRVVGMAPLLRHAANADGLFADFRHGAVL